MTRGIFTALLSLLLIVCAYALPCLAAPATLTLRGAKAAATPAAPQTEGVRTLEDGEKAFQEGKEEYQKGRYSKAIEKFQSILDGGFESPEVYYNLGNAWYKARRPGYAILNYERALRRNPRDGDARENLSYVTSTLRDRNRSRYGGLRAALFYCLATDELTAVTAGFYLLFTAFLFLFVARRREWHLWAFCLFGALLVISGIWLGLRIYEERGVREAVVVASSVEVRNGPADEESVSFTLHEGSTVRILQDEEGWAEVVHQGKARGWVREGSLERI